MGFRFTAGRIILGFLMIVQGIILINGGFKEQLSQFKDLRAYLNRQQDVFSTYTKMAGNYMTDQTLNLLVYGQALTILISGALMIADVRVGGLGLTVSMFTLIATRDNPLLALNDHNKWANFQNMLKDLGVAGMGLLFYMRRQTIRHRYTPPPPSPAAQQQVKPNPQQSKQSVKRVPNNK